MKKLRPDVRTLNDYRYWDDNHMFMTTGSGSGKFYPVTMYASYQDEWYTIMSFRGMLCGHWKRVPKDDCNDLATAKYLEEIPVLTFMMKYGCRYPKSLGELEWELSRRQLERDKHLKKMTMAQKHINKLTEKIERRKLKVMGADL